MAMAKVLRHAPAFASVGATGGSPSFGPPGQVLKTRLRQMCFHPSNHRGPCGRKGKQRAVF